MKEAKVAPAAASRPLPIRMLAAALAIVLVLGGAGGLFLWWRHSQTVAVVNGERITQRELFDAMYARAGQESLDELVLQVLVTQAAREAGVTVGEAEVQERIQDLVVRFGGEEAFAAALSYYGLTRAVLEEDIRLQLLAEAVVMRGVVFSDSVLRALYDEDPPRFGVPERVRASHILLYTEGEAHEVLARLQAGEDFAALALELSQDEASAANGGDLGLFAFDEMVEEFSLAAFSLGVGELSGVVPSWHGYHVILVTGHEPAQVLAFEEVREEVLKVARQTRVDELLPDWMTSLRYSANIEYRLPGGR